MEDTFKFRRLVNRLARLHAAEAWEAGLNPSQADALAYLAQANALSRQPSHVADYLASTRGTVSQTLKVLLRRGLVTEVRSDKDKRRVRYDITSEGTALAKAMGRTEATAQETEAVPVLEAALRGALARRGMRSFGLCRTCRHHRAKGQGGHCALLSIDLSATDAKQLCHEHEAA